MFWCNGSTSQIFQGLSDSVIIVGTRLPVTNSVQPNAIDAGMEPPACVF